MEDRLYFNDKDLRNAVMEFAEKYFYDFPLAIFDICFGRKVTSYLGLCEPLRDMESKGIVYQNIKDESDVIESNIEINGYFKGLNVTETILHEMCHAVNHSMGDIGVNHGKLFKDVAEVISKRSGYEIHTTSSDDYLNKVLSCEEKLKKFKKDPTSIVFARKVIKEYLQYEDIYAKFIDELNNMYKGVGDIMADLIENGDVDDVDQLNKCADEIDKIIPKGQLRLWNFK